MITHKYTKGFTVVELVISVAIFGFMTAFLVAKYGNFNQGILITNLAYDVALTIRNAQTYGLNVKSRPLGDEGYSDQFDYPYGVHFNRNSAIPDPSDPYIPRERVVFFADLDSPPDTTYTNSGENISIFKIKGGSYISNVCAGTGPGMSCAPKTVVDITFHRPDPNAIITADSDKCYAPLPCTNTFYKYAEITLTSSSGLSKIVIVRENGQIEVQSHL